MTSDTGYIVFCIVLLIVAIPVILNDLLNSPSKSKAPMLDVGQIKLWGAFSLWVLGLLIFGTLAWWWGIGWLR